MHQIEFAIDKIITRFFQNHVFEAGGVHSSENTEPIDLYLESKCL